MFRNHVKKKWLMISLVILIFIASTYFGLNYLISHLEVRYTGYGEINEVMLEKLRHSGKFFILDRTKIELMMGRQAHAFFGLDNSYGEERVFGFVVRCIQKLNETNTTPCDFTVHGGIGAETEWFELFQTTIMGAGEAKAMVLKVGPFQEKNLYEYNLEVYMGGADGSDPIVDPANLYASEEFTVVVI